MVYNLKNVLPSLGCGSIVIVVLPPSFFCALTVNVIDLLFLRQCFTLQKLLHHRFAATRGNGVQHRISLGLCQLRFARALLEHIVHRARWLRQLP